MQHINQLSYQLNICINFPFLHYTLFYVYLLYCIVCMRIRACYIMNSVLFYLENRHKPTVTLIYTDNIIYNIGIYLALMSWVY